MRLSYLIRDDEVPVRPFIWTESHHFNVYLARKCIGLEDICYRKSELISLTRATFRGRFKKMVSDVSDRLYFVIDGEITNFMVGNKVYPKVKKGDLVLIPKGTTYSWDWGELEYMVINSPPYMPGSDRWVEESKNKARTT